MNNEDREKLKKIFLNIFHGISENTFDFNKDRSMFEDWDSLTHMQLLSEVESTFNVNFEIDEVINVNKPEDLVILIQKKQNG